MDIIPRGRVAAILQVLFATVSFCILTEPGFAQQRGGLLRITHRDSPASMSIHGEGTISVVMPLMGVFNNLVVFDQHVRQNGRFGPDGNTAPTHLGKERWQNLA